MTEVDVDQLVSGAEAARMAGVQRATFTAYVARGQAPAPSLRIAGRPLYLRADIEAWLANRPGRGHRRDLEHPSANV